MYYFWKDKLMDVGSCMFNGKEYVSGITPSANGWHKLVYEEGGDTNIYMISADMLPVLEHEGTIESDDISQLGEYASTTPYERAP